VPVWDLPFRSEGFSSSSRVFLFWFRVSSDEAYDSAVSEKQVNSLSRPKLKEQVKCSFSLREKLLGLTASP
jgi:hypothetical protein